MTTKNYEKDFRPRQTRPFFYVQSIILARSSLAIGCACVECTRLGLSLCALCVSLRVQRQNGAQFALSLASMPAENVQRAFGQASAVHSPLIDIRSG